MLTIADFPPSGYQPDNLAVYFMLQSPPFEWILRRGEGWVILDVGITFKDGKERHVTVTIGKYPTYPGYPVELRLNSDLILELGLIDDATPTVGKVDNKLPVVGKRI